MRWTVVAVAALAVAGLISAPAPEAVAEPTFCNDAFCTPGIKPGVVLGAPCGETNYYVFGTTSWGRLVFCGSPRRYAPRYFRSLPMVGIKEFNSGCTGYENKVAQAPDGLYLFCTSKNGRSYWDRGGNPPPGP
jgi:hypothetical protein